MRADCGPAVAREAKTRQGQEDPGPEMDQGPEAESAGRNLGCRSLQYSPEAWTSIDTMSGDTELVCWANEWGVCLEHRHTAF